MMSANQLQIGLEEFLKLPETKPASEYIDGKILQKTMPKGKHSIIQSELITHINNIAKKQHIAYAFPKLRCIFAERVIVPDIAVFKWARITLDENGDIAD